MEGEHIPTIIQLIRSTDLAVIQFKDSHIYSSYSNMTSHHNQPTDKDDKGCSYWHHLCRFLQQRGRWQVCKRGHVAVELVGVSFGVYIVVRHGNIAFDVLIVALAAPSTRSNLQPDIVVIQKISLLIALLITNQTNTLIFKGTLAFQNDLSEWTPHVVPNTVFFFFK